MTEQEAIKDIQRQLLEINSEDKDITLSTESLRMAIKALEKVQKYQIPVEIGDEIVMIKSSILGKSPASGKVQRIEITKNSILLHTSLGMFNSKEIGKTIFLTAEEAYLKMNEEGTV